MGSRSVSTQDRCQPGHSQNLSPGTSAPFESQVPWVESPILFSLEVEIQEQPPPHSLGPLPSPGHSPTLFLPQNHISCLQVKTVVVAGALSQGHTATFLIHEGVVRAATAFHRRESLEAVGVAF